MLIKTFQEYHELAYALAKYPGAGKGNILYGAIAVPGEAGELAEKVKKLYRNFNVTENPDQLTFFDSDGETDIEKNRKIRELRVGILKEAGDILWELNALLTELGSSMEEAATMNIDKLYDRRERGVLLSEGDNR